ncbi:MAG: alanine dehydrogenase [Erysipelotrichaceae bacterium]
MIIGLVKERKTKEYRVALGSQEVAMLVQNGHRVYVEQDAGVAAGFSNADYEAAGATLCSTSQAWASELVVKVKEPLPSEYGFLRKDLRLFTYLHLAADKALLDVLLANHVTAFAYETLQVQGRLPLLAPMSEIAGKVALFYAMMGQRAQNEGQGVLLMPIRGVVAPKVLVIGGGNAGQSAIASALALGNEVSLYEKNKDRLPFLRETFPELILLDDEASVRHAFSSANVVIVATLHTGAKAEKLLDEALLKKMPKGSIIIDISIDQGGSIEGNEIITTHEAPFVTLHGVNVCTIANLPGMYPHTSSRALHQATFPYVMQLATTPLHEVLHDAILRTSLQTHNGLLFNKPVAQSFNYPYVD